jgi:hypothetical protein
MFALMKNAQRSLLLLLLISLLLAGCNLAGETNDNVGPIATETTAVVTTAPTETTAPPVMILLAGPDSDPTKLNEAVSVMGTLATENGMVFEHRQILAAESAPDNLGLVVVLPPANGLQELAAAQPAARFLALGVPGVSSSGNLVVVGSSGGNTDFQAFLAGYIAAVQSDDWRVGLVYLGDQAGQAYRNAFLTGAVYYCGSCNPYFPPFNEYPLYVEVPVGAGPESFQSAVDSLVGQGVNTIHLAPGAQSEALYRYAASFNLRFVGTDAPPSGLEAYWIASVISTQQVDMRLVISQVLNGQAVTSAEGGVEISFTGLSEARLNFFREVLGQLENGAIDPQGGEIE